MSTTGAVSGGSAAVLAFTGIATGTWWAGVAAVGAVAVGAVLLKIKARKD